MSDNVNQSLSSVLGIEPISPKQEVLPPAVIEEKTTDLPDQQEDYKLARSTFRSLINKGNDAIEDLTDLAKQSESPRAYEVLATLMKTVGETTNQLFSLQKKVKDLNKDDKARPHDETRVNVERAVFVGTTAELLKKVKNNEEI